MKKTLTKIIYPLFLLLIGVSFAYGGATFSRLKTWSTGETMTASQLNAEFNNILNNLDPSGIDDESANDAAAQATSDPYADSSLIKATSLQGEIQQLRYLIAQITGETYWYIDPDINLASSILNSTILASIAELTEADVSILETTTDYIKTLLDDEDEAAFKATINFAHASDHQSGGGDAIKLDDLAAPDNNTDLNASITKHGLMPRLDNNVTHFFNGQGGQTVPTGTKIVGDVIQVVNYQTGAVATGSTVTPVDDTIPQKTEGDEYMTLAITPTAATNKLRIEIVALLANNNVNGINTLALHQDDIGNALAAVSHQNSVAHGSYTLTLFHYMTAGTTSETTFKVRIGPTAGVTTLNGSNAGRLFGGVAVSSITITEIQA